MTKNLAPKLFSQGSIKLDNLSKNEKKKSFSGEYFFFFHLSFLSGTFTSLRTAGEGGGYFFNSSLLLPPASQALRNQPGGYCRELTSADSQQPDSNREPLVSERKSLITKLRAQLMGNLIKISISVLNFSTESAEKPQVYKFLFLVAIYSP